MSRSFLFVPADSERKLEKACGAGADALILDLEDAVAAEARPAARKLAAEYLQGKSNVWVRVNPIDTDDSIPDLEAVMQSGPAGIVLPKPRSAADAVTLSGRIDVLEAQHGIEPGSTNYTVFKTIHHFPINYFSYILALNQFLCQKKIILSNMQYYKDICLYN